jgi:osmoprotectant transport system permease protein
VIAAGEPLMRWDWVGDHVDEIRTLTVEHLELTAVAVSVGFVISMVLSLTAVRWRRTYGPMAAVTGLLYSIPSLALFAALVPITGLGFRTAEIGLVTYTLLILLRNIVAGIDGVPDSIKEAADGMGMTPWRRFVSVELRLATPAIVAGLRIATVTTVGLVTVTALVGNGGYGDFINDGLQRSFPTPIILGCSLSIAMAIALDVVFVVVERAITPWQRGRR